MTANRILDVVLTIVAFIVVPVQLVTTFALGILVNVTFGLLLLPISAVGGIFLGPLIGLSWLCNKVPVLRNPLGILFLPWAVLGETFVALTPSMGELENRAAKMMICRAWPFSWEFWEFWGGPSDLVTSDTPEATVLREVLARASRGDALTQRMLARLMNGEELDPGL